MGSFLCQKKNQIIVACFGSLLIGMAFFFLPNPYVTIVIALLPLMVILYLKNSFFVCLAFILFSFFRLHEAFSFLYPFYIPQILAILTMTTLLFCFFMKKITPFWMKEMTLLILFFFIVVIGVIDATNRAVSLESLLGTYSKIILLVFAISWLMKGIKEIYMSIFSIIGSGLLIAIVAINNKINGVGLVEGTRVTIGRSIGSILGDPNDLSLVLIFPVSFTLAIIFTKKINMVFRVLGVFSYIILAAAIVATQSRGGILGLAAITAVQLKSLIKSKSIIIIVGMIMLSLLISVSNISERSSGGSHEEGIDESAMGRLYAWEAAIKMALHHPINGVGIKNFYYNYYLYSSFWDGKNHAVHSTWFEVLAETGIVGFFIFINMILLTMRNSYRSNKFLNYIHSTEPINPILTAMSQSLLLGFVGFCVIGTFLTQAFLWPFYILFGLQMGLNNFINKNIYQKENSV